MRRTAVFWAPALAVFLLGPALMLGLGIALVGMTDPCRSGRTPAMEQTTAATQIGQGGLPASSLGLTTTQWQRASIIVAVGQTMRVPTRGIVVALAVARQESGFKNYANDGRGGDLASDQIGIARSLRLPHDAVGTDHGSVGVFQQQWPWWGTLTELMEPADAARKFYRALLAVRGWQDLPLTVAAQRVQRSAYPDAYADDADTARRILEQIGGSTELEAAAYDSDCPDDAAAVVNGGAVGWPVPAGLAASDRRNWGGRGSRWSSWHTGTDFSVACGTPVFAAHAGTARIDRTQSWGGPHLLRITNGRGRLTTWYAHMRQVDVVDGQRVNMGQRVGQVGQEGNATGCHLHFEVHTKGGSIYGPDNTNPTTWLKLHVGRHLPGQNLPGQSPSSAGAPLSLMQYNVKNREAAVDRALLARPTLLGLNESHRLARAWQTRGTVPGGYALVNAGTGSAGRRQNSLLVAPGVRVLATEVVPLSAAVPGDKFGHDRWALVVELDVPGIGRHVHIQTHLNAGVRYLSADASRAREYAASVQNFGRLLDRYRAARSLSLAGDMNLGQHSDRPFAWAPLLAQHGLEVRSVGIDVVATWGLTTVDIKRIARGPSDHPALGVVLAPRM